MAQNSVTPINLMWSFAGNAENVSVAVGGDGTTISTFVSNSFADFDIYGAFGQLLNNDGTPGFQFYGTDDDFDNGESPATVAIDPVGLAVEVHETDDPGSTLWINVGQVGGGQGSLGGSPPIETTMSGRNPSIIAVAPGQFLVAAAVGLSSLNLWLVTLTGDEEDGWAYLSMVVDIDYTYMPQYLSGLPALAPRLSYYDGILAVAGASRAGVVGTFDMASYLFTPYQSWSNGDANSPPSNHPNETVAVGPNNAVYYVAITGASGNWTVTLWAGTYQQNPNTTLDFTFSQNLFVGEFDLPANYPLAADIVYTTANGLDGLVMAVLSYCNCIDLFYIPASDIPV